MINTWPKLFFPLLAALALSGCGTNMGPIDQNDLAAEVPISAAQTATMERL